MTAFWRAWSIWAVSVALTATALVSHVLYPLPAKPASVTGGGLDGAVGIVFIGAFATVGALLAWKRPGNPIGWLLSAIALAFAATGAAAVASLAFRYRRARTAERAQLKWLVYAAAVIVVAELASALLASTNLQNAISSGTLALVPLAIGVAVLRYRLYDIDRIISRTLAYAIVTGLLIAIYAGLVLLATQVLGIHSAVAVAAATLIAAALFNPVRRRVQHRVDRRFNRARYDAETTVAAFAARLKDATDLDTVRADLATVVQAALEPAQVWIWTGDRQPAKAARAAARIASSSPSSGSFPSMRSPST
jgi:hypothetical protein